jgi:hypothetical protein
LEPNPRVILVGVLVDDEDADAPKDVAKIQAYADTLALDPNARLLRVTSKSVSLGYFSYEITIWSNIVNISTLKIVW